MEALLEKWEEDAVDCQPEVSPRPRVSSLRRHRFGKTVDTVTPPGSLKNENDFSEKLEDEFISPLAAPPGFS
jgi:hypothetical protein